MPRFDGTGPMGRGPRTGWGQGRCGVTEAGPGERRGAGQGHPPWGGGRGHCWGGDRCAGAARRWWPAPWFGAAPDTSKGEGSEPEK